MAIVSQHDDLHAWAIRKELTDHRGLRCHIVPSDRLADNGGLVWADPGDEGFRAALPTVGGESPEEERIDVVWFRRGHVAQTAAPPSGDPAHDDPAHDEPVFDDPVYTEVIDSNSSWALLGVLLGSFTGRWVSDTRATRAAESKALQLKVARETGLRVPRTLISNDPRAVRRFCAQLGGRVVVKAVRASRRAPLLTQRLRPEHLEPDERIRLCPAIYQECVPGRRHLRVHVFGDVVLAVAIESSDLDWRTDLDLACRSCPLDDELGGQLLQIVRALGLRMGVIDLKFDGDVPVWLKINPQGQFLFAEGLTGAPLRAAMADLLCAEARAAGTGPATAANGPVLHGGPSTALLHPYRSPLHGVTRPPRG
ncbi:hypothetical protein ACFC58_00170 [Kitasatospora purpeofusca]|uniref:hypothetical protein n=1 Tax=Kitasatospora purpeofusca TaxID=67352 RepID=UPI0035D688E2